jgi:NAD(P)H-flavin reductase
MYTITRREAFSDTTFLWEVMAPDVAKSAEPGHFVMLRLHEGSERIPLRWPTTTATRARSRW